MVAGGGLAGTLAALYLARAGCSVEVYERRSDPRSAPPGRAPPRSINLAISTRGLRALEAVGLADAVRATAVPMRGRTVHAPDGRLAFAPYGTAPEHVLHSVRRRDLNSLLLRALEPEARVSVSFSCECHGVDPDGPAMLVEDARLGRRRVAADVVVGADGSSSAIRRELERLGHVRARQHVIEHGYKELTIAAGPGGRFLLEPHALHIWPRGAAMMVALPNRDGSFTATLFWPLRGERGFDSLRTADEVVAHFATVYPDVVALMPTLAEDFLARPAALLSTIHCRPWHHRGRVVLIGDAAHAVLPFYGQGANAALEDCLVLHRCLTGSEGDWDRGCEEFQGRRLTSLEVLAELSLDNFIEMRERVATPAFWLRRKLEQGLSRLLPRWFVPLYTMVTFTSMPYDAARARAARQWRVAGLATAALITVAIAILVVAVAR